MTTSNESTGSSGGGAEAGEAKETFVATNSAGQALGGKTFSSRSEAEEFVKNVCPGLYARGLYAVKPAAAG